MKKYIVYVQPSSNSKIISLKLEYMLVYMQCTYVFIYLFIKIKVIFQDLWIMNIMTFVGG